MVDRCVTKDLTQLLNKAAECEETANALLPVVYGELRKIASAQLRRENSGHTLLTTDLVHEAYLKLFPAESLTWNDKRHFFASAAVVMRRILVDHARRKSAKKRMDHDRRPESAREDQSSEMPIEAIVELDYALELLEQLDERQCQIVQLKVFAGLTGKEIAQLLEISDRTVAREWWSAKAWLKARISQ